MPPVILAFDAALPFVCSQEFTTGDKSFRPEDPFPWQELGIDARTLHSMWRAGFIRCTPAPTPVEPPKPTETPKRRK